jgi:hypothetical protein
MFYLPGFEHYAKDSKESNRNGRQNASHGQSQGGPWVGDATG